MIELFGLIKTMRVKSIKIQCNKVPFWKAGRLTSMLEYIKNNEKYCIDMFHVEYDTASEVQYISSFNIEAYMSNEEFDYLNSKYGDLIEKYYKYSIDLSSITFWPLQETLRNTSNLLQD